jgi:sterol desaturase/sphingolipid hydroxylase (fatty acid hydroxylase superfamily)
MAFLENFFNLKGLLLIVLVFVPFEQLLPLHAEQKIFRRGWLSDVVYVFLNGILIRFGLLLVVVLSIAAFDWPILQGFRQAVASQPHWLQAIELIALADLCFYGMHRLFHAVPLLWRFHAVHHSIEEMDWLAAHRIHALDQILTKGASLIPAFTFGFSEWAIVAFAVIYQWHTLLIHANVRLNFGPLRWLISSPEFHHWHHSNQPEAYKKNFAAQLSLWDLVFSTAHMPKGETPSAYGVNEPVPAGFISQFFYPFRRNGAAASPQSEGERINASGQTDLAPGSR